MTDYRAKCVPLAECVRFSALRRYGVARFAGSVRLSVLYDLSLVAVVLTSALLRTAAFPSSSASPRAGLIGSKAIVTRGTRHFRDGQQRGQDGGEAVPWSAVSGMPRAKTIRAAAAAAANARKAELYPK